MELKELLEKADRLDKRRRGHPVPDWGSVTAIYELAKLVPDLVRRLKLAVAALKAIEKRAPDMESLVAHSALCSIYGEPPKQ